MNDATSPHKRPSPRNKISNSIVRALLLRVTTKQNAHKKCSILGGAHSKTTRRSRKLTKRRRH
jgi:hypothetical protein